MNNVTTINVADTTSEITTTGLVLPDGAILEQLAGGKLILSIDGREQVGTFIEHGGSRFVPARLDLEFERALHLPEQAAEFGSAGSLINDIATFLHDHGGLDSRSCLLAAGFILASWVPEMLPLPPCLNIWGPAGMETALRDALSYLCRHSLTILDASVSQLSQLPSDLIATLFLRQPSESALRRLLAICGDQTVFCGDRFLRNLSPTVVFTLRPLSALALRVALPSVGIPYRRMSQPQILELRNIQQRLLKYRLSVHRKVASSCFDAPGFGHETRTLARILGSCLEGEEGWQKAIVAALEDHDEAAKVKLCQTAEAVVVESLLVLIHEERPSALVGEITELANAIITARQEKARLSSKAVGTIVSQALGLRTRRKAKGFELLLDLTTSATVHGFASAHGVLSLLEPRSGCAHCRDVVPDAIPCIAGEPNMVSTSNSLRSQVHVCDAALEPSESVEVAPND